MSEENARKLVEAVRAGDKASFEALLAQEPQLLQFKTPNGSSLLLLTAYYGHPELAEVCLKRGAKPDVFEASALGDLEAVKNLVSANRSDAKAFAPDGFYPLGLAAFFGHGSLVEFLLKNGADVLAAARNAQKVTALHGAVARQDAEIVRMLLEAGADPNARQERGFLPLHDAAANGQVAIVELLLKHGARADAKNEEGKTAADMAADRGHLELAERLRKAPAA